jgi:ubiquinone/menaquinone biosynthesis C-methylase UbiE
MTHTHRGFLPAAGHDLFLPLYDVFAKLLGADAARRTLVEQAALEPGHRVLDVGCGTGTLLVLIKRLHPQVDAVGLDPDTRALGHARRKAERAGITLKLNQGFADALPYPDAHFDRVFSSFMFHHLERDQKPQMLSEIRRVLKPGGRLELVDFAAPEQSHSRIARLLPFHKHLHDNIDESILALITGAGLADARIALRRPKLFGDVLFYEATT